MSIHRQPGQDPTSKRCAEERWGTPDQRPTTLDRTKGGRGRHAGSGRGKGLKKDERPTLTIRGGKGQHKGT